jgi:phage-related holin
MLSIHLGSFSLHSFLTKIAILVIAYFTPIAEMVHVMLIFLALDMISGIWASVKAGQKIKSHKLRQTVYKFLWYTIAVMTSWMMEKTFNLSLLNLACVTAGFICFVELKSIFENITRITGDPVFMRILKTFKHKGSETIRDIVEDDDNNTTDNGKS